MRQRRLKRVKRTQAALHAFLISASKHTTHTRARVSGIIWQDTVARYTCTYAYVRSFAANFMKSARVGRRLRLTTDVYRYTIMNCDIYSRICVRRSKWNETDYRDSTIDITTRMRFDVMTSDGLDGCVVEQFYWGHPPISCTGVYFNYVVNFFFLIFIEKNTLYIGNGDVFYHCFRQRNNRNKYYP